MVKKIYSKINNKTKKSKYLSKTKKSKIKYNKKQNGGGPITKEYIDGVFDYLYKDIFIESPDYEKLLNTSKEKGLNSFDYSVIKEYVKENIFDYDFLDKNIYDRIQIQKIDDSKFVEGNEGYDIWVATRFNVEKRKSQIRVIDTVPQSGRFRSLNHREFNISGSKKESGFAFGHNAKWNILCYYKNENCNLYNCGLGIIYKSKEIDEKGNHIIKRVALPVMDGLTLKIRDCYFWHFTPELQYISFSGIKMPKTNQTLIKRTIIRSYHGYGEFEKETFCYTDDIESLPVYQFTESRNPDTPPVRTRLELF